MKNSKHFILLYLILIAVVLGILVAGIISFYMWHKNDDKIQSGIHIKGINVSGLTKEEAKKVVSNSLKSELNDHIVLKHKNYEYYVEIEQFDAEFDIDSSVELAYNAR